MINLLQRFEAFMYFDEDGALHINRLPGGLFSEGAAENPVANFVRNPDAKEASHVILDEKQVEYNFASTSNRINVFTLDRESRASVLYTHSAFVSNIRYRRVVLLDQPALGDIETARTYSSRLGERIFYPIRKSAFKTVGSTDSTISTIFDFITIDDDEFRLMGIQRSYSSDENSFINEYNVEWLGGR
jgi:hypothetical protein